MPPIIQRMALSTISARMNKTIPRVITGPSHVWGYSCSNPTLSAEAPAITRGLATCQTAHRRRFGPRRPPTLLLISNRSAAERVYRRKGSVVPARAAPTGTPRQGNPTERRRESRLVDVQLPGLRNHGRANLGFMKLDRVQGVLDCVGVQPVQAHGHGPIHRIRPQAYPVEALALKVFRQAESLRSLHPHSFTPQDTVYVNASSTLASRVTIVGQERVGGKPSRTRRRRPRPPRPREGVCVRPDARSEIVARTRACGASIASDESSNCRSE